MKKRILVLGLSMVLALSQPVFVEAMELPEQELAAETNASLDEALVSALNEALSETTESDIIEELTTEETEEESLEENEGQSSPEGDDEEAVDEETKEPEEITADPSDELQTGETVDLVPSEGGNEEELLPEETGEKLDDGENLETSSKMMASSSIGLRTTLPSSIYSKSVGVADSGATVLTEDGTVYAWGYNWCGELGIGTKDESGTGHKGAHRIPTISMTDVSSIRRNNSWVSALKNNGDLYLWGLNGSGKWRMCGLDIDYQTTPYKVMSNVKTFDENAYMCAAVTNDGGLYTWGQAYLGYSVTGSYSFIPTQIDANVRDVALGRDGMCAYIKENGDLYYLGSKAPGNTTFYTATKIWENVRQVVVAYTAVFFVTDSNELYGWGSNYHGELGIGSDESQIYDPIKIMDNVMYAEASDFTTAAITIDGKLYVWGMNDHGEVGDGTTEQRRSPVLVLSNVCHVDLGEFRSLAVTNIGDLFTWGSNTGAALGDGTTIDRNTPEKILEYVAYASWSQPSELTGLAISTSGDVYVWGNYPFDNLFGEYKDYERFTPPVPVMSLKGSGTIYWPEYMEPEAGSFKIDVSVKGDGTIFPYGNVVVDKGADQKFVITPNEGNQISSVIVDGNEIGPVYEYTFTNVDKNHSIEVTFAISSEVRYDKIRKGKNISKDELFSDYSYYLVTNKGYEEYPSAVLADMGNIMDKTNYSGWGNFLTALSYNMKHTSELYKWYGDYLTGGTYGALKEYEIEDDMTRSLILAMAESDESAVSGIKLAKKSHKAVDTFTKIISAQIQDQDDYLDDKTMKEVSHQLAESWDGRSEKEIYDYFKHYDEYEWAKDVEKKFKGLGIAINAMDCIAFFYLQQMTSKEITEELMASVPKNSQLYKGLERLNAKQQYLSFSIAEAIGKFAVPFAEKWVEKKIGLGTGVQKASEILLSMFSKSQVTVSGTSIAVGKVIFYLTGTLMNYSGVNELDDVLKANVAYCNALDIDIALGNHRSSLWNYGYLSKDLDINEAQTKDEFLFAARDAAIKEAYNAIKKLAKGSDLETLTRHYEEYRDVAKYDLFIDNCMAEAALGIDAVKKVPVVKPQSSSTNSLMSMETLSEEQISEEPVTEESLDRDMLATDLVAAEPQVIGEEPGLFISRIYSEEQMPIGISIPDELNGETVVGIGEKALFGYSEIKNLILPDTVKYIENQAFADCFGLTEIFLGMNTRSIKSKAFSGCTSLTTIDIPVTVEYIADDAFEGISALTFVGEEGSYAQEYAQAHDNISFSSRAKNVKEIVHVSCSQSSVYMDEDIAPESISMEVEYDDGTTGTVTEGIRFSFVEKKIGSNKVNVLYGGCSDSFTVDVISNDCSYSVIYVNHDLEEIAPEYHGTAKGGEKITLPAPAVDGYFVDKDTLDAEIGRLNDFIVTFSKIDELDKGDIPSEDVPKEGIPEGIWASGIEDEIYTSGKITPEIRVYDNKNLLVKGKDYTVTLKNNIKAYTYSDEDFEEFVRKLEETGKRVKIGSFDPARAPQAVITMKGNYSGSRIEYFRIEQRNIEESDFAADNLVVQYNKKKQTPAPVLKWKGKKLAYNKDFFVKEYQQEINNKTSFVGEKDNNTTYSLTIVGMGDFQGERSVTLTNISSMKEGKPVIMMGKTSTSKIPDQVYKEGDNPAITLDDLKDSKGNAFVFKVTYKGKILEPGIDYEAELSKNDTVGTASITLRGLQRDPSESATGYSFAGYKMVTFAIKGYPVSKVVVSGIEKKGYKYTGDPIILDTLSLKYVKDKNTTINLEEGTHYTLDYKNNDRAGTATLIITGQNLFSGTKKVNFKITSFPISDDSIKVNWGNDIVADYEKGGAVHSVALSYRGDLLINGVDYTVKFLNNNKLYTDDSFMTKNPPSIVIQGRGCFTGTRTEKYLVERRKLNDGVRITVKDITASSKANAYKTSVILTDRNGKNLTAGIDYDKNIVYKYASDVTVKQKSGKTTIDVRRSYGDPVNSKDIIPQGTLIRAYVTGKGNYEGLISATYTVLGAGFDISKATFTIASQKYLGTGKTVKLSEKDITKAKLGKTSLAYGSDYRILSYENNTKAGTAKVTFEGIGQYGGKKTVSFKISGKPVSQFWKGVFNKVKTVLYSSAESVGGFDMGYAEELVA